MASDLDFAQELHDYATHLRSLGKEPCSFEDLLNGEDNLYIYALYLAYCSGVVLPPSLHARILFSPSNEFTRRYVKEFLEN